ncbi:hypothetical protein [Paenibacillus sp. LK1]|uniref:hypothetical protein n=1 Tax=Paenibacillus sp. LK1 TaxID=2053014 RepID=UPI000C176745|nr:hypothetical protein [Paenibacillus sp. LK1]PIH55325.1 hypothetical protein CS562_32030 [Paenibacillus sp. LK1]
MIKDLMRADKQKYQVFLTFKDGTNYVGEISLTSDKNHVKIKSAHETVWIPLDEIVHYSVTISVAF